MAKKYFIKTFGCQMNVYDSNRMANMLEDMGLEKTADEKDADVVIFNTCHIREKAAEKVFSDLGRAYLIKQERLEAGKDTIIGVTGCVVQAEDKEIMKRAPYVDFALGPLRYFRLKEVVEEIFKEREAKLYDTIAEIRGQLKEASTTNASFVKILENMSKDIEDIKDKIKE